MNPHTPYKLAGRLLIALTAISSLFFMAACGSSNSLVPPNNNGFTNGNLSGTYVISISGTDVNGSSDIVPFAIVGTIIANGSGGITGGTVDINDPGNLGVLPGEAVGSSSSYAVGVDGRCTGTLVTAAATFNVDFVLTSSSHGLISRFDDSAAGIGTGSGTIDLQTNPIPTPAGSFAFSLAGVDVNTEPLGTVGAFTINSTSITGAEDFNDDLTSGPGYTDLALSGQFIASTSGPGTAQFDTTGVNINLDVLNFDVWVIDSTHLKFIETDGSGPYLAGDAFTQVTSFSAGQLVFTLDGFDGTGQPVAAGGYATTDANGDLTNGLEDYNDAGVVGMGKGFSTTSASCVAGRCQLVLNGFSNGTSEAFTFVVYPSSGGGEALEIDSFGLLQGASYAQSATSFTGSGGYGLNLSGVNLNVNPDLGEGDWGEVDDIAQFDAGSPDTSLNGTPNMTGLLDENDIGNLPPQSTLSGVYVPDTNADGRGSILSNNSGTLLGGFTLQYYVVNSSTVVFIDVDSTANDAGEAQVGLGTFQGQSSSQSGVVAQSHMAMVHPLVRPHGAFRRK